MFSTIENFPGNSFLEKDCGEVIYYPETFDLISRKGAKVEKKGKMKNFPISMEVYHIQYKFL